MVENTGNIGAGITGGQCDISKFAGIQNEYPLGSGCTHGRWGLWVGAKRGTGSTVGVSTGGPHCNPYVNDEFFPTAEPWDTVWAINKDEIVDIPYWNNYTGISHQDIVTRFSDYFITSPNQICLPDQEPHNPLYIEVISVTYVWSGLDAVIYRYWIISKQLDLTGLFVSWAGNAHIYQVGKPATNDEFCTYDEENRLGIIEDITQNWDDCVNSRAVAFRMFPEDDNESLIWSWDEYDVNNDQFPRTGDNDRYELMTRGIVRDPIQSLKYGHFLYSLGPFQLPKNDTIQFDVVQVHGKNVDDIYNNLENIINVRDNNYKVPAPPPMPPLKVDIGNHQVKLSWRPDAGETDPETYQDEYRLDGEMVPFEGYRVYKSTNSISGPWTILAEYDILGNGIGEELGLQREYLDIGLLNNLTYYYTVTSFSKPDTLLGVPSQESSIFANAKAATPGTSPPDRAGIVAVVPNPYRSDAKYYNLEPPWESSNALTGIWGEENRRVQFINLPSPSTIRIFTLKGSLVTELYHGINGENEHSGGILNWNLTSRSGQAIASGIYLFSIDDKYNNTQVGKFVVIK